MPLNFPNIPVIFSSIFFFFLHVQFIRRVCADIKGDIKKGAYGISLIKAREAPFRLVKMALISGLTFEFLYGTVQHWQYYSMPKK